MSIDLSEFSGLPLKLDKKNRLVFGKGMKKVVADVRTREQMIPVLKNNTHKMPKEFYYMYRNVCLKKDEKKIEKNFLRYDITILPPFVVGDEYNKTFGHYHPKIPNTNTWYPEVYEVIHGRAHYFLQDENSEELLIYDARQGDKCLMLPGYGHVTINPSKETLVMANWVFPGFKSIYEPVKLLKGFSWYETKNGLVKNRNYGQHGRIKLIYPKIFPELGLTEKPIYNEAMQNPKKFEWLYKPQKYLKIFQKYLE
ncbi:MAG: glucose-6-phosphate isomerase family protein [Candidatus Diapherotrites archaeon]